MTCWALGHQYPRTLNLRIKGKRDLVLEEVVYIYQLLPGFDWVLVLPLLYSSWWWRAWVHTFFILWTPPLTHREVIPHPLHALRRGSDNSLEVAMPVSSENIQECCLAVSAGPSDQFILMLLNQMVLLCCQALVTDLLKRKKKDNYCTKRTTSLTFPLATVPTDSSVEGNDAQHWQRWYSRNAVIVAYRVQKESVRNWTQSDTLFCFRADKLFCYYLKDNDK